MKSNNALTGFLETIEIKRIVPSTDALRNRLELTDGLILSIAEKGLLEPLVVRPIRDGFEVVAGSRRLEACKRLRMSNVPCHVVELDDKAAFEVSLVENVQRETLNPIDEARAFKKYVDSHGYGSVSELAKRIGKSQEYVSRRIQLLKLPAKARQEVMRRRISPSVAQELAGLEGQNIDQLIEVIGEDHLTMREVRRAVRVRHAARSQRPSSIVGYRGPDALEKRTREVDRAIGRAVASVKMDIYRLDEVIGNLDEGEWVVREFLFQCRSALMTQIDGMLRFKKKFTREMNEYTGLCD